MFFVRRISRCVSLFGAPSAVCAGNSVKMNKGGVINGASSGMTTDVFTRLSWLDEKAPCFPVKAEQVQFLRDPDNFYSTLKEQVSGAKRRIVIASLYLGTGKLEEELVQGILTNMDKKSGEKVEVQILLDYTRGTRGICNSCSMLRPLVEKYSDRVSVSLFHTPDLRGLLRRVLPERFNETIGLQHMKIYLFDDNIILSGANLSESYFTNRQDRYVVFKNTHGLANFFSDLVNAVSSISFHLQPDSSLVLDKSLKSHPYEGGGNGEDYREEAKKRVMSVIDSRQYTLPVKARNQSTGDIRVPADPTHCGNAQDETDTVVYPLVQMAPFGITVDQNATEEFLRTAARDSTVHLASGYFNLTSHYRELVLNHSQANFNILTASPEANGFYGAHGISGAIPNAYNYIERQFLADVDAENPCHRIHLHEYFRNKWTFHAKGLWHTCPHQKHPSATFIGSPNFGTFTV